MSLTPHFPTIPAPTSSVPSNELVHFRILADRSRCTANDPTIDERLSGLEQNGLTVSISQLVASANLHFAGSVQDEGYGLEDARMRAAWNLLKGWKMVSVPHYKDAGRMVLVVAEQPNSRMAAIRSEVLAMGIALEIGIRLYDVAYPYWAATEGLQSFDLSATDEMGNEFRVEARGRLNRNNKGVAIQQVYAKFANPNFTQAAGVIFFPRTNNKGREDIIVLDPKGQWQHPMANSRYRNLLMHYAPVFMAQGGLPRLFGERLRTLSAAQDEEFSSYLQRGDPTLSSPSVRRGRSGFRWKGTLYIGAFFKDIVWPAWLTKIQRPIGNGVFFWGLAEEVISIIQRGRLTTLRFAASEQPLVSHGERLMSIVMPDRTLLIWGESMEDLASAEDTPESELQNQQRPTKKERRLPS